MADKKNILLKVSPEFHKDLKIYVTLRDVTLQDYIVDLIKKDIRILRIMEESARNSNSDSITLTAKWKPSVPLNPQITWTSSDTSIATVDKNGKVKAGNKVGPTEMQQLANILGITTPGVKKYDSWGTTLKNKILNAYKEYGFSKGGVVRGGIPASILDMIGADALIPRGDSTLIGANPGETVLTEEFTKQLKPTVQILNEFNRRMAQPIIEPSAAVQNQTTEVANEYHFTFNNPVIKSQEDVQKMIEKAMDDRTKRNKRDWKKVR